MEFKIIKIKIHELTWAEQGIIYMINMLTRNGESMHLRDLYELTADSKEETTEVLLSLSKKNFLPEIEINPKDGLIKNMILEGFSEAKDVSQN